MQKNAEKRKGGRTRAGKRGEGTTSTKKCLEMKRTKKKEGL